MQEEGTDDEINDVMLMGEPDPTLISANLDEKLEHSGEAEAKRINAKYGVLPNDQCLTVLEMAWSKKTPKCSHGRFHMANEGLIQALQASQQPVVSRAHLRLILFLSQLASMLLMM